MPLSPYQGMFSGSMWTRQDDRKDTILHRAVRNNYDTRVINLIVRADSKVCSVKDGAGCLAVEVVLRACDSYGKFTYEELPLDLLCMLFEKMTSADIDHAIAASSAADRISHQREVDFRTLAKSLKQIRAVKSINVHLLGHGCAGKSTLRSAFRHTLPNPSRYYGYASSLFGFKKYADPIDINNRTIGCEVETIKYNNQHWRFFDYGGQEKFHANHDRFLKLPGSLYIIIVALCDFRREKYPRWNWEQIREKYTYWLRFLASTFQADTVPEIFTVLNGKSHVDKTFISDIRKKIRDEQMWWVTSGKACWKEGKCRHHPNVTTLRFLNDKIPCIDNNRLNAVRDALNDVMVQTIVRVQREANLYSQILSNFDRVRADARVDGSLPAFIAVKEFKESWLSRVVDSIGAEVSPTLKEYLKDWMLQRLLDLKEVILISKDWMLTDETWVTRNLLGEIIARKKKSPDQKCLLTTQDVLKLIENGSGNKQLRVLQSSLGDLLESIGACVRVNINHVDHGTGSRTKEPPATTLLFFPMIKVLVDADAIRPMNIEGRPNKVGQQIIRKFVLCDCAFSTFPPGYFERLFAEIVSLEQKGKSFEDLFLDTYENALVLKCGGAEVFVKTEGDEFTITMSTLTDMADYIANISTFISCTEIKLASICDVVRRQLHPPIEEYCCHPDPKETASRLLVSTVGNLHDPYIRQMFYGITLFNNVEFGMERLSRSVRRVATEASELCVPYSFVLTNKEICQSDDRSISASCCFVEYLRGMASIRSQIPFTHSTSSKLPEAPSELWLYVVDQSTMEPIVLTTEDSSSDRYPIKISKPSEFIENWLYLILSTLSEMEPVHGISGIAQLLGYPETELSGLFELDNIYVTKYDDICCAVNHITNNNEKVLKGFLKGFKLHDLKTFYTANNCLDIASICNLQVVEDDQGYQIWTVNEKSKDRGFLPQTDRNDGDHVATTSWELKLQCYIWKEVSFFLLTTL